MENPERVRALQAELAELTHRADVATEIDRVDLICESMIKQVDAVGVNVLSNSEDTANARITFENGCVANINTSRVSMKKVREIRVFQPANYLSLDFMNQTGHFLRKEGPELVREEIPIEKDEPLKLELESFLDVVQKAGQPKVGAELGKSALELAIQIAL